MCRYHINIKEKCLVDGKTGDILRPACFADLAAMYSYMCGTGEKTQADEMIKDVFRGHKPITKMIAKYQDMSASGNYPALDHKKEKGKR